MAISVTTAYATIQEASAYLIDNASWTAASFQAKTEALLTARYYIDGRYTCGFDQVTPPDEVKYASALLAADSILDGDLFFTNDIPVKKKSVKAGPVSTSKEYSVTSKKKPSSLNQVDVIMSAICSVNSPSTKFLIRA